MKALKFVLIALIVLACHKKKEDPKPAPDPTITVYITKGDYYPNGVAYIGANVSILNQSSSLLNGTSKPTDSNGKVVFTSPKNTDTYGGTFNYSSYYFQNGFGTYSIASGKSNIHVDSFYVHTIYE